jgi:hypothetical protein
VKTGYNRIGKQRIDTAAVNEKRWRRSGVLDAGNFTLTCTGNESNSFGTGFLINRKYKQEIMNFEAVDDRICSLRMRGKFNNFTILSVHAPTEENDELFSDSIYDKLSQIYQRIPAHDTKIIVSDFNAKTEREGVFKPFMWICRLHKT